MKHKLVSLVAAASVVFLIGCAAHTHVIGNGAKGGESISKAQWYAVWGLVPLGNVDTKEMAGGATDYTIKTKESFVDFLIGIITENVTIVRRTVTVEK